MSTSFGSAQVTRQIGYCGFQNILSQVCNITSLTFPSESNTITVLTSTRNLPQAGTPPIWQNGWFILSTLLCLTAVIFFFIKTYLNARLSTQRLESDRKIFLEKERSRIARDLNDSLGSELFGLKLLGQVALAQNSIEGSETYLQKMITVSKGISEKISEVIWLTDANQDNLESLWSYIQKNALLFLKPSEIDYHFELLPDGKPAQISGERRHEILNFHKQLFLELTKSPVPDRISMLFKIEKANLVISIRGATIHNDTLYATLVRLKGKFISNEQGGETLKIPLAD